MNCLPDWCYGEKYNFEERHVSIATPIGIKIHFLDLLEFAGALLTDGNLSKNPQDCRHDFVNCMKKLRATDGRLVSTMEFPIKGKI